MDAKRKTWNIESKSTMTQEPGKEDVSATTTPQEVNETSKPVSLVVADEATASASSAAVPNTLDCDHADDDEHNDGFTSEADVLPLLKYARAITTHGNSQYLPREIPRVVPGQETARAGPLSSSCTCSAMAQVLLTPTASTDTAATASETAAMLTNDEAEGSSSQQRLLLGSDLWKQPHTVLAVGWQTGTVRLLSVASATGTAPVLVTHVASSTALPNLSSSPSTNNQTNELSVRDGPWNSPPPVVDVSWDSSGTILAAVDAQGTCAIWDFKYDPSTIQPVSSASVDASTTTTTMRTTDTSQNTSMFSSFMSALTGMPPTSEASTPSSRTTNATEATSTASHTAARAVQCLSATVTQVSRITYPSGWSAPTCICLDPSHKRKITSKMLVVGFADGRLMLTKRGGLFQRRNDTVLYQGGDTADSNASGGRGIESVTWRGNLIAWADSSGVKLLDVDTLTRIAHIDRPTGARPSLYPSLRPSMLMPRLVFETSKRLLVAWGDCLLGMDLRQQAMAGEGTSINVRRTVECTMAWELDCVASGVAPLDENHIMIVGIVVPEDDDENDGRHGTEDISGVPASNDVEVQILSRHDGTVKYADVLPTATSASAMENMHLLSSFAVPRMDNASEWDEYKAWSGKVGLVGGSFDEFDLAIFGGGQSGSAASSNDAGTNAATTGAGSSTPAAANTFVDPHLKWSLESVLLEEDQSMPEERNHIGDVETDDDTQSVDSDDYGFLVRPREQRHLHDSDAGGAATTHTVNNFVSTAPVMVLSSKTDLIMASVSNIDDAIEHALNQHKCAVALRCALKYRRQLRRYTTQDLVQHYLDAVLQLTPGVYGEDEDRTLSLRRMKLAIQTMPVLLGGQTDLWKKWTKELQRIPGALFVLRGYLPVRDPSLPQEMYEQVLLSMMDELERLASASAGTQRDAFDEHSEQSLVASVPFDYEAAQLLLDSLLAWGPTKVLKEYVKLFHYSKHHGNKSAAADLKRVETALQRRYRQTAAGYLEIPLSSTTNDPASESTAVLYEAHRDEAQDSLYRLEAVLDWLIPRVPILVENEASEKVETALVPNDQTCLEAVAMLRMMQNRYDQAFKCFLAIGACHSPISVSDLEAKAIETIQGGEADVSVQIGHTSYDFVLGVLEHHHLHRLLLDPDFVLQTSDNSIEFRPLLALLRLVGLSRTGEFLMEHCVAPETLTLDGLDTPSKEGMRRETLPMDQVAEQLESSPALLHWYLSLVLVHKPELYVNFPNNSIPPKSVTELHRRQFQLYLDFVGKEKDSVVALAGTETYKVESKVTPFLSFLKAALPLGGIPPVDARRQLEMLRSQESDDAKEDEDDEARFSRSFSLELAYIIENYSDETEAEALGVLDLYLEGADSITLGVAYAQRHRQYSSILWDKLINYCLPSSANGTPGDGLRFGALLEAAALSGADLARLVESIPPGMVVEGLRPRLVAAVADYRLKLDIHQAAAGTASEERVALLREVTHRSRRGARYIIQKDRGQIEMARFNPGEEKEAHELTEIPKTLRTVERRDRHILAYSIPMR